MLLRKLLNFCAILPIINQVRSVNIRVSRADWKIWANEEVYKCTDPLTSLTNKDIATCCDLIEKKISDLKQFFNKIENVIENTTYESHPIGRNAEVHAVEKVVGKFLIQS